MRLAKRSRDGETVVDYTQSVSEKATTLRALDMDMDYGDGAHRMCDVTRGVSDAMCLFEVQ